ncbi:helix-turn-helix domain-containing protein [Haloarcula sediminis]|uniref:helix-turn-helix domain-containing protein n=1 Tax=Haloarcula sediminis TaxID=3111777 RepID=UPI002D79E46E|nr:helix-turn-helix domain-containing protein [Haloarcula sp. CK38]
MDPSDGGRETAPGYQAAANVSKSTPIMKTTTSSATAITALTNHGSDPSAEELLMATRCCVTDLNVWLSSDKRGHEPKLTVLSTASFEQMREFVFEVRYETGADELMDLFIETPDARSTTFLCSMGDAQLWRLDRITGPESVVEQATALLTGSTYNQLTVSDRPCGGRHYSDVLENSSCRSLVYSYFEDLVHCDSIPTITNRYINGALLFEITRQENTERWRILMESDKKVGMLYDTLGGVLQDGLSFHFDHVSDASGALLALFDSVSVRPEQRRVLELAAENGYYETPRQTTLDDLAEQLDWPRSTVSYRLRQAEAALVDSYMSSR